MSSTDPPPLPLRACDLIHTGREDRALRRLAARGSLTKVAVGSYLPTERWQALSLRERHIVRAHTHLHRLRPSLAASHWSAAAIWGFPVPDAWPREIQVIDCARTTSTRGGALLRRPGPLDDDDVADWQGIRVTTPVRTSVDIALVAPFAEAVVVLDHCLRAGAFTVDEALGRLARRLEARRRVAARSAIEFASPLAEWPGESFSRVGMAQRGITAPTLQHPFFDDGGKIGVVDFWWPDVGVVGEFDGDWKYTEPKYMSGRTAVEVLRDEKRRQSRLEAHPDVRRAIRWDYPVARTPDELARRLIAVGVPRRRAGERR